MGSKEFYFAYFLPDKQVSGVVRSWDECKNVIIGVKGAKHKKFSSHLEALDFIKTHLASPDNGGVVLPSKNRTLDVKKVELDKNGIYFDSGTGRGAGVEISVTNFQGLSQLDSLIEKKIFLTPLSLWGTYIFSLDKGVTNNFGELFAFYCALQIAKQQHILKIYGDSKLVLDYWSLGRMNPAQLNKETVALIETVTKERQIFESQGGEILFITGKNNPADMGFHK